MKESGVLSGIIGMETETERSVSRFVANSEGGKSRVPCYGKAIG